MTIRLASVAVLGEAVGEAEEDVGVGLFEDVSVDVFGVLGDYEEAEFVFATLFDGVTSAVDDCM